MGEPKVSEVSERYRRLSGAVADKIAAVPDGAWENQSPCADWTARDVVRHLVSTQGMFLGFVGREPGAGPSVDEDPLAAWNAARAAVQTDLDDPTRAKTEFDGHTGRSTFEAAVGKFLCMDLVVHGWDLARATGLDEHIEADDIARVQKQAEEFGDALRSPGAFGPAVDPPGDADARAKMLAFLGRQP